MPICLCVICKKETTDKGINTHWIRTHNGVSFTKVEQVFCSICNKEFSSKQALVGHISRSHTNKQKQAEYGAKGTPKRIELGTIGVGLFKHSEETKEHLSIMASTRLAKHSKYTKNIEYKPGIILESSYEVAVAEILDRLGIEWIKVRTGFIWDDNGKKRRYIPDFYLPQQNIYLDPKNDYLISKDKRKIESAMQLNNIKVFVLAKEQINERFLRQLSVEQAVL